MLQTGAPIATRRVSVFFPFVYLEMVSLFPSIFCTIAVFSLYREYVVRTLFLLPYCATGGSPIDQGGNITHL